MSIAFIVRHWRGRVKVRGIEVRTARVQSYSCPTRYSPHRETRVFLLPLSRGGWGVCSTRRRNTPRPSATPLKRGEGDAVPISRRLFVNPPKEWGTRADNRALPMF